MRNGMGIKERIEMRIRTKEGTMEKSRGLNETVERDEKEWKGKEKNIYDGER